MHDLGELILEGVANSWESGADYLKIEIEKALGFFRVQIQDNGTFQEDGKWFDLGVSSKGDGRGRGLFLIKSVDENATLERRNNLSTLVFCGRDDGSLNALEDVLFPIFQFPVAIQLRYIVEERVVLELSKKKGEEILRAKEIAKFKDFVRLRIRSV